MEPVATLGRLLARQAVRLPVHPREELTTDAGLAAENGVVGSLVWCRLYRRGRASWGAGRTGSIFVGGRESKAAEEERLEIEYALLKILARRGWLSRLPWVRRGSGMACLPFLEAFLGHVLRELCVQLGDTLVKLWCSDTIADGARRPCSIDRNELFFVVWEGDVSLSPVY